MVTQELLPDFLVSLGLATKYYDVILVESTYCTHLFSTLIFNATCLALSPEDNEFHRSHLNKRLGECPSRVFVGQTSSHGCDGVHHSPGTKQFPFVIVPTYHLPHFSAHITNFLA